jgi:hypothetical protein
MRRAQNVHAERREEIRVPFEPHVLEDAGEMRGREHVFDNPVASLRIGVGQSITQRMRRGALRPAVQMPLLFVEQRVPVGHEKLKIPNLWPVDRRVIDFRDAAVPNCEPHAAVGRVGCADPFLAALCPPRLHARLSERVSFATKFRHSGVPQ